MLNVVIESALRSLVLALAVGLGLWIARTRGARLQMAAWTLVLAGALLMPLLMRWRTIEMHTPQSVAASVPVFVETVSAPRMSLTQAPVPKRLDWGAIGLVIYNVVAAVLLLRLLIGLALTFLLWRRARRIHEVCAAVSDVRESRDIGAPATFGWSILLPVEWRDWDSFKLRSVMAHEAAHVEWGDFFTQLAGKVHTALFWFSPLAWWLENRMIHLAEAACDDAALQTMTDRSQYASMLLALAESAEHPSAVIAMARPATVKQRVERILSGAALPANPDWRRYAQVAAIVVAVAAVVAGSSIRAQQEPVAPREPAAPAAPAAAPQPPKEPESDHVHNWWWASDKHGDAYAIVSGDSLTMSGSAGDARRARSYRGKIAGDYLWFERDGKEYLVTDPETVKRAEQMFGHQQEQRDAAAQVALMARLAQQQALLGKTQDEEGAQLPLLTAEVQAVLAAQKQLREEKSADLLASDQFRQLEDQLLQAKEKDFSPEMLRRLQEQVSQAQAKLSGDLASKIAELESKLSELQSRLAELQSRVSEKQALLDQKLLWDRQLRELTSQLESQSANSTSDASQQLRQLLEDCLRNGLAHAAR